MESETSRIGADLVGVKVAIARWEGPETRRQRLWLVRGGRGADSISFEWHPAGMLDTRAPG